MLSTVKENMDWNERTGVFRRFSEYGINGNFGNGGIVL